ncbi:MAG: hypothetical protein IKO13_05695 [Oscillospiraceae bacterium]|nr:hypothetical protein [Oscillospiraceae bacterium]
MKKEKPGFRVDCRRPAAVASMLAFACCIPLQIAGYADRLNEPVIAAAVVLLPVLSAALMIAAMLFFGRTALRLTLFPVCLGVAGFAFKLVIDPYGHSLLHHISAVVLYFLLVLIWALTVFDVLGTKRILELLLIIPFFKHILVNDIPVLTGAAAPISASAWLKELSILSFLLALFFCVAAFEDTAQQDRSR